MPRRPRSQPRPCQSMFIVFQLRTWIARLAPKSTRYTPPWLSPWRLPRTTDVATSMVRTGSERVAHLYAQGARRIDRLALHAPSITPEQVRPLIPEVIDEDRGTPVIAIHPEAQV